MKKMLLYAALALGGGLAALGGAHALGWNSGPVHWVANPHPESRFVHFTPGSANTAVADFTYAAEKTLPVVVNIKNSVRVKNRSGSSFFDFQGIPEPFR